MACIASSFAGSVAALKAPTAARKAASARGSVRNVTVKAGLGSSHWLPGTEPPAYLDGNMAGDYGTPRAASIAGLVTPRGFYALWGFVVSKPGGDTRARFFPQSK
jgi:hypothetical protein